MNVDDFFDRFLELCHAVRKMTEEEWLRLLAVTDAMRSARDADDASP